MVKGLSIFQDWFKDFENQYVLIGGTAATITMTEAGLPFRGTKDLDIVLHVEVLTWEFGQKFWEFVQAGGYQQKEGNAEQTPCLYRFQKPLDDEYYQFVITGRKNKYGMPSWVGEDRLIPLKAVAWMEMTEREANGEAIDSKKINKHLADVVQLSGLLQLGQTIQMVNKLKADLQAFAKMVVELKKPNQVQAMHRIAEAYSINL